MKFYLAEMEMREAVEEAKTLEDFVRIGFSHVEFKSKRGEIFYCYEMIGDHEVEAYPIHRADPMVERLNGETPVEFVCYDRDDDGYTIVIIEEKKDEEVQSN